MESSGGAPSTTSGSVIANMTGRRAAYTIAKRSEVVPQLYVNIMEAHDLPVQRDNGKQFDESGKPLKCTFGRFVNQAF